MTETTKAEVADSIGHKILRSLSWCVVRVPRSRVRAFAPVLLFALFLIFFFGLTFALHLNGSAALPTDPGAIDELRARIFWGASFAALGVVTAWSLAVAGATMTTYLAPRAVGLMVIVTVVAAFALGMSMTYVGSAAQTLLFKLQQATNIQITGLTACMNVVAASSIVLFAVCCVALGSMPQRPLTATDLRQRIFDLRVLLFSSAALLVTGVAEIFFLFDWPRHVAALAADPLSTLAPTISKLAGALYTFLLAVFYVPVALVHERWRLDLQNQLGVGNESFDSDAWEKKTGLATTAANSFSEIAALVSPLLTAIGVPFLEIHSK